MSDRDKVKSQSTIETLLYFTATFWSINVDENLAISSLRLNHKSLFQSDRLAERPQMVECVRGLSTSRTGRRQNVSPAVMLIKI